MLGVDPLFERFESFVFVFESRTIIMKRDLCLSSFDLHFRLRKGEEPEANGGSINQRWLNNDEANPTNSKFAESNYTVRLSVINSRVALNATAFREPANDLILASFTGATIFPIIRRYS